MILLTNNNVPDVFQFNEAGNTRPQHTTEKKTNTLGTLKFKPNIATIDYKCALTTASEP